MVTQAPVNRLVRDTVARIYRRHLRTHLSLKHQQRLKLLWHAWGYRILLTSPHLSFTAKMTLLRSFLRTDWSVPHAHKPLEISHVVASMAAPRSGNIVVEAGCWKGGSTAKLSEACSLLGLQLHVFDSFQGVEPGLSPFSGAYGADLAEVRRNVERWGEIGACQFHAGWFRDTCRPGSLPSGVKTVYIDCDLAKGTREILECVIPSLSSGAEVFSQDFHIPEVQAFLAERASWDDLGVPPPASQYVGENTIRLRFDRPGRLGASGPAT